MLKVEQLYYLYLVYRLGSIKLAAQSIPVTPSAVSTAIHKLEDDIGVNLMEHKYRSVELTAVAKEIAIATEDIFKTIEHIEAIITKTKGEMKSKADNKLNFYLSRGYYQGGLSKIFEFLENMGFDANVPDISCGNEKYLEFVSQDKDAVLINFFKEPAEDLLEQYPEVEYYKILSLRPCVYCARNYSGIDEKIKEITPQDVCKLPILLFTEGFDLAMPICEMLEEYGELNLIGKYSNISVMTALLEKGKGVSVSTEIVPFFSINTSGGLLMKTIPIKTDMRLALMVCYNKRIDDNKKELLKKMAKHIVVNI